MRLVRPASRHVLSAAALAGFGLLALGSKGATNKSGSGNGTESTNASPVSTTQVTAAEAKPLTVLGTCTKKAQGSCTEYNGFMPTMAADLCKDDGGTFARGGACPTDAIKGSCTFKAASPGAAGEVTYYYSGNLAAQKNECDTLKADWKAFAAPAAATPPPAAKPAAAAVKAAPAAKPAAAAPAAPAKK